MKVLFILGTRPEAIKLAPLIIACQRKRKLSVKVCVTAQHRGMMDQVLSLFGIVPDHDLDIMKIDQNLFDIVAKCMRGLKHVLRKEPPDIVIAQGDTTTAFAAGLAAYYSRIPFAHVEAGLRTHDKYNPFPEEVNRRLLSVLADYHFAPTGWARDNLVREGVPPKNIWVTGNTVIDSLLMIRDRQLKEGGQPAPLKKRMRALNAGRKVILVTGHRRENFGRGFRDICAALKKMSESRDDVSIVYPVHLNPNVRRPVMSILGKARNIHLIEPLDYDTFIFLMRQSYLILTDSGGIQEEAPTLGKPVLLMRNTTERPEAIRAGAVRMVGTEKDDIVKGVYRLLDDKALYNKMSAATNPYGDGKASDRILKILASEWKSGRLKK